MNKDYVKVYLSIGDCKMLHMWWWNKDMIAGNTQFHDDPYKAQDLEEEITFHQFDYE